MVDIVQPSPSHAGGISEVRKISSAAESADVLVSLHCPLGPISLAACLHLDMVTPNSIVQAQSLDIDQPEQNDMLAYLTDPDVFAFTDGYVTAPEGPGLGIDVDEAFVREQAQSDINWQNPIWYHDDGSIAEW